MEKETVVMEKNLSFLSDIRTKEVLRSRPALAKTLSIIDSHPEGITVRKIALKQKLCPTTVYKKIYTLKEISAKEYPEVKEKLNRILSNVIKEDKTGRHKKPIPQSMKEFKEFYFEENEILIFILNHKEGWTTKDVADFLNASRENSWYRIKNLRRLAKETDCQELKEKINTAFSYSKIKHERKTPETINSIEEFNRFFSKTAKLISFINSLPDKMTIIKMAERKKVHKDTIYYHLKIAKKINKSSSSDSLKEYLNQAIQKTGRRKKKSEKTHNPATKEKSKITRKENEKILEPIAGETKDFFCPDCKRLLVLGKCMKCGKVWKQTKKRIIVTKTKESKEIGIDRR